MARGWLPLEIDALMDRPVQKGLQFLRTNIIHHRHLLTLMRGGNI